MTKPQTAGREHLSVFIPTALKESLQKRADSELKTLTQLVRELLETSMKGHM